MMLSERKEKERESDIRLEKGKRKGADDEPDAARDEGEGKKVSES